MACQTGKLPPYQGSYRPPKMYERYVFMSGGGGRVDRDGAKGASLEFLDLSYHASSL